jgi:hypothetical protein
MKKFFSILVTVIALTIAGVVSYGAYNYVKEKNSLKFTPIPSPDIDIKCHFAAKVNKKKVRKNIFFSRIISLLMNKLFKKTQEFVFAQQTSMISSTIILSAMMILARLFGFLRYRILTNYFEVRQLDIYFASFKIPDLIFEVLITGALSTSFIPFFIKYKNDHAKLSKNISSIINFITLILFLLIVIVTVLANFILPIITPGFSKDKIDLIVYYSRIILIGQLPFLVVGNFFTGISQARKRFLIPAVAPIIYNVGIIICTILFSSKIGLEAPVLGVVIGAFLFFIIQLPVIFVSDFEYRFIVERSRVLWDFFRVTMPRVFTVITAQIEATVDQGNHEPPAVHVKRWNRISDARPQGKYAFRRRSATYPPCVPTRIRTRRCTLCSR